MDKSIFNFKVQYQDGSVIDLDDLKMWVSSFRILSPSPEHMTETVEGKNGSIYLETTLKERKITSKISFEAMDYKDFDLFRDQLFQMFNPLKKFYIIRDLQPMKRMFVSVNSEFDIDYLSLEDGEFDIEFVIHSVFIESIGTTLYPGEQAYMSQTRVQDIGDPPIQYVFSGNHFSVWNDGDVTVDPREIPLTITFNGLSTNLTIKNLTTSDEWSYSGTTVEGDSIVLDGIRSLLNEQSIIKDTNKNLITLSPGWNDFEIVGTTGPFTISFDFRFYYF